MSDAPLPSAPDSTRIVVPSREIPVPAHLSAEAQTVLSMSLFESTPYPALDDHAAWTEMITARDAMLLPMFEAMGSGVVAEVDEIDIDGVAVHVITPEETENDEQVVLDFHGGALILGGGACSRASGMIRAGALRSRIWSVDYRMPPDHPYPTPLDDCVAAYRSLLEQCRPEDIVVSGGSAGANLAGALVLRARDEGLPLPGSLVLMTPELDLTESGDTFHTNLGIDAFLTPLMPVNLLYADGHDLSHPYLSPLLGDFERGFPPTFLSSGTRDLFLSNAVRMHQALRAAEVHTELHILEGAPHGGFMGSAPEDRELNRQTRRFISEAASTKR
ncbi:MAG: monoterpene epsilon-lactone hydrolase [Candidatus Aldehydirespiratoraceae bacterium]|jgi:monoterpene epsilon-lactone hydrolase